MQAVDNNQKNVFQDSYDSTKGAEVLLVTANVGSLFEDPERLLKPWVNEFLLTISQLKPDFIALHLQEVGGKTYEKSMEYVQEFVKNLCEAEILQEYSCMQIYMDEDYRSAEHFTALGNLYFTHQCLENVKIWNFLTKTWEVAFGKNIYSGNIEAISTKEKSKFPQHFFPECKWSRKGFMRTRWNIRGTVLDLVNIHLFHDASNLTACEEFPSIYCKTRRRALVHTLERFHLDEQNGFVPFFVFGDFNFRCDAEGVVKELTENLTAHRVHNIKHDSTKVHYRNSEGNNVLTVGKKEFIHVDHQLKFKESWLKKYDRELEPLRQVLFEYPIEFPPTYPYEEDPEMPTDYMSTRCPAWCDRILMSLMAKEIVDNDIETDTKIKNSYNIIGERVCMGDHKPIYLHLKLKPNQGTYRCCRCHLNFAKTNKSASHEKLASIEISEINANNFHCPYCIPLYKDILIECTKQNRFQIDTNRNLSCNKKCAQSICSLSTTTCHDIPQHSHSSQLDKSVLNKLNHPTVSINIFDSDNIHVCMCSQKSNPDIDDIDGSFCQECHNKIKKQPLGHSCSLVSRQLMLSNDIIVNRVDTQYLNTHFDYRQERLEPYTPESAESHSPYPEPHSTSTSSSNSRSTFQRFTENIEQNQQDNNSSSRVHKHSNVYPLLKKQGLKDDLSLFDTIDTQRRGISPGQLKSRLEDLQRSSLHNLNDANCIDDDVDNVDKICPKFKKQTCCCLPLCCII